jgi:hypothetical protein
MNQYLLTVFRPDDADLSKVDEAVMRDIVALNEEMKAARVRIYVGGIPPAASAKSVRPKPDGTVVITDGPYAETKEHIGGVWVLIVADLEEALTWARKAALACRAPVEVNQIGQRIQIDWPRI